MERYAPLLLEASQELSHFYLRFDSFNGELLWRAPSSPHRASGLNGSFFPQSCTVLNAALARSRHGNHLKQKSLRIPARVGSFNVSR